LGVSSLIPTEYHQDTPFNNELLKMWGKRPLAGCGPIAVLQMGVYFEDRELLSAPTGVQWSRLYLTNYSSSDSTYAIPYLTHAVLILNRKLMTWKLPKGTWTPKSNFKLVMPHTKRFENLQEVDYSIDTIKEYLDVKKPLIVYGFKDKYTHHYWIADGYKKMKRDASVYETDDSGTRVNTKTILRILYTYNMGWGGNHDGYYNNKIFHMQNSYQDG
jgi:hypothetical protein